MLQINSCTLVEIELTFKRHVLPSNYEPPFKGGFFLLFCKKITRISAGKTFIVPLAYPVSWLALIEHSNQDFHFPIQSRGRRGYDPVCQ